MASVLKADGYEPQPMFDRRAFPIYALLALGLAVSLFLMWLTGVRFTGMAGLVGLPMPLLWAAGLGARRIGYSTVGEACQCIALTYSQAFFVGTMFALAAMSGPMADDWLGRADQALGFDWPAYVRAVNTPLAMHTLNAAYRSFDVQPALVVIALFVTGRSDRAWQFALAGIVAVSIAFMVFPFAPAIGPYIHYGIPRAEFPIFGDRNPWTVGSVIQQIKDGQRLITPRMFSGLVSMPSYHAAVGGLVVWAMWPTKFRWPFTALNAVMFAACLVIGSHYLVDLIGGLVTTVLAVLISKYVILLEGPPVESDRPRLRRRHAGYEACQIAVLDRDVGAE